MSDTNVGLGMVAHKAKCVCVYCEADKARTYRKALRQIVHSTAGDRGMETEAEYVRRFIAELKGIAREALEG